jgi:hypothetical protein
VTGKSGKNMVASFDSFGIKRSGGGGPGVSTSIKGGHAYLRDTIQDDFLNENDVEEEDPLQASIESGEIQAMFSNKKK